MVKLKNNINSSFFEAARKFSAIERQSQRVVYAYVEGYDDVAFWRVVLSKYESANLRFEINVPDREDLAKGKKILLSMLASAGDNMILCMDSDFDYLFGNKTPQSSMVNSSKYIFQTYTYAIENYLCYPPSLRSIAVKATKNDTFIFDFELFMKQFSEAVYPIFIWYIYSAFLRHENFFPLLDFKNTIKIHYIEIDDNGASTIQWLERQCSRKLRFLKDQNPRWISHIERFKEELLKKGVTRQNIYLYMHGHTLYDNVVSIVMDAVCEALKIMKINIIRSGTKVGVALSNELSNYKNTLMSTSNSINDNEGFKECELYKMLDNDIANFVDSLKK